MVQMNFSATQYQPSAGAGGDVFEDGLYAFQITNSEIKETKAKTGYMLVFTLTCVEPGHTGRRYTIRLNIVNQNSQAQEIAYGELSAISHVCGVLNWSDTQQLHGRPFKVQLAKKPRQDDPTKFGNDVLGYFDMNGNPPAANGGNASAPAQAPQAAPAPYSPATAPAPVPVPAAVAAPAAAPAATPAAAPAPAPWQAAQSPVPVPPPGTPTPPWQQG